MTRRNTYVCTDRTGADRHSLLQNGKDNRYRFCVGGFNLCHCRQADHRLLRLQQSLQQVLPSRCHLLCFLLFFFSFIFGLWFWRLATNRHYFTNSNGACINLQSRSDDLPNMLFSIVTDFLGFYFVVISN